MLKLRLVLATPVLAALAFSGIAQARPTLVSSTPAANATIARTGQINLVFSEKVRPANMRAQLVMTTMPGMAMNTPMAMPVSLMMGKDGKSVMVMSRSALTRGSYELRWTAAGDDREAVSGKFAFQVR